MTKTRQLAGSTRSLPFQGNGDSRFQGLRPPRGDSNERNKTSWQWSQLLRGKGPRRRRAKANERTERTPSKTRSSDRKRRRRRFPRSLRSRRTLGWIELPHPGGARIGVGRTGDGVSGGRHREGPRFLVPAGTAGGAGAIRSRLVGGVAAESSGSHGMPFETRVSRGVAACQLGCNQRSTHHLV